MIWVRSLVNEHIYNLLVKYYEVSTADNNYLKNKHNLVPDFDNIEAIINIEYVDILKKIKQDTLNQEEFLKLIYKYNNNNNELYDYIKEQLDWYNKMYVLDANTRLIIICFNINKFSNNNRVIETVLLLINYFLVNNYQSIKKFNFEPLFIKEIDLIKTIVNDCYLSHEQTKRFDLKTILNYYEFLIAKLLEFELDVNKLINIKK